MYRQFRTDGSAYQEKEIGHLYGFTLYIASHRRLTGGDTLFSVENELFAQRSGSGIRYTYNGGAPNVDNPKLAARYFLNAIDRASNLLDRHQSELAQAERELPLIRQMINKPFEKDNELKDLKTTLASLERSIALKLEERRQTQDGLLTDDKAEKNREKVSVPETKRANLERMMADNEDETPVETLHKPLRKAR